MLIIVFLQEAKKYTVVPEEFVYGLDEKSLKNNGVNSNQTRLIYFSKDIYEKLKQNVQQKLEPKFYLPITNLYPLPADLTETCFKGRLYGFECKFLENIEMILNEKYGKICFANQKNVSSCKLNRHI